MMWNDSACHACYHLHGHCRQVALPINTQNVWNVLLSDTLFSSSQEDVVAANISTKRRFYVTISGLEDASNILD